MNYIKELIEDYYQNKIDKGLIRTLIGIHVPLEDKFLSESLHEFEKTKEIINKLEKFISNNIDNKNNLLNTGYNLIVINNDFIFTENIENYKNNANIYPIYVYLIYDKFESIYASILDRDMNGKNNEIDTKNNIIIKVNVFNYKKTNIMVFLKHELLHAIQMYKEPNNNLLQSSKNMLSQDTNDISSICFNKLQFLFYIMTPSEQDAHLNGFCQLLDKTSKSKLLKIMGDNSTIDKIYNILNSTDFRNVTRLYDFYNQIESLENYVYMNKNSLAIHAGYFLSKHKIIKEKITKDYLETFMDNDKTWKIYQVKSQKILEEIKQNYFKYKKRLVEICYKKLEDKNIL